MANDFLRFLGLIERLGNLGGSRLKTVGADHRLQPVHVQILLYLAAANRYSNTPQSVTDYLGLTKGTVSQSLILLERKGFLERRLDGQDRRVIRLALTAAGQTVVKEAEQTGVGRFRAVLRDLPDRLLEDLTEVLRRLQVTEGRRSFGVCRTCRHHQAEGRGRWRCGLTGEPLSRAEGERICREHEVVPKP